MCYWHAVSLILILKFNSMLEIFVSICSGFIGWLIAYSIIKYIQKWKRNTK